MNEEQQKQMQETMQLVEKFIALANEIKDEGKPEEMVNTALQLASGTYSTYLTAGNEGYLHESGINKLTEVFKYNLTQIQNLKKAQHNPEAKD
jgi:hypothetical protein